MQGHGQPFTTVERKDVGLMLRVRRKSTKRRDQALRLAKASKVDRSTLGNSNGPRTTKRSIESDVLVEDGNIIVIGGLLDDSYAESENKVPLMGDLPLVGSFVFAAKTASGAKPADGVSAPHRHARCGQQPSPGHRPL